MPFGRGLEPKGKSLLSDVVAFVTKEESVIVGAVATGVVALASDLNIAVSNVSVAAILTPLATGLLVALDKKLGLASKITALLPPKK
jgi:hypothetical protein